MSQIKTKFIADSQITYAKIQNETASTILGNPTGSPAAPAEITLGAGLAFSGTALTATGSSPVANVAANDSNVVFVAANNRIQICTPTANRTYTMPTTAIVAGDIWTFQNLATAFTITLQSSGSNSIVVVPAGCTISIASLVATPTTAGNWGIVNPSASRIKGALGAAPGTGFIGQKTLSQVLRASPVSLTTGNAFNIVSTTLTAGTYLMFANVGITGSATTTLITSQFSTVSATFNNPPSGVGVGNDDSGFVSPASNILATNDCVGALAPLVISVTTSTTYYLVVIAAFPAGTASAYGRISACLVG